MRTLTTNNQAEKMTDKVTRKREDHRGGDILGGFANSVEKKKRSKENRGEINKMEYCE